MLSMRRRLGRHYPVQEENQMRRIHWYDAIPVEVLLVVSICNHSRAASPGDNARCTVVAIQALSPSDTRVERTTVVEKPVPYCAIVGKVSARSPDSDINFQL